MQPRSEGHERLPEKFYELAKENDLYRFALPAQYGGWDLSELDILRVQSSSPGPGGMRMHPALRSRPELAHPGRLRLG